MGRPLSERPFFGELLDIVGISTEISLHAVVQYQDQGEPTVVTHQLRAVSRRMTTAMFGAIRNFNVNPRSTNSDQIVELHPLW